MRIRRSEITNQQWADTSYLRTDGKEEFRERKEFGNRHVVFENGSIWGEVHYDQYNATNFPKGTVEHASNYVEEKTGIPQGLVTLGIVLAGAYVTYKAIKFISKKL